MKEPTQQYSDTIKSLQSRIQALEDENRLLKERLEEAGVSYADRVCISLRVIAYSGTILKKSIRGFSKVPAENI